MELGPVKPGDIDDLLKYSVPELLGKTTRERAALDTRKKELEETERKYNEVRNNLLQSIRELQQSYDEHQRALAVALAREHPQFKDMVEAPRAIR